MKPTVLFPCVTAMENNNSLLMAVPADKAAEVFLAALGRGHRGGLKSSRGGRGRGSSRGHRGHHGRGRGAVQRGRVDRHSRGRGRQGKARREAETAPSTSSAGDGQEKASEDSSEDTVSNSLLKNICQSTSS